MASAPTRPAIRYFGGKWKLAPWIASHFPAHRVYVEPYCGAASVLLRKPRSYAEVINDLDGEVVNLFEVLRDPAAAATLKHLVELTPFARKVFEAAYERTDAPIERARRTIIRAFMGHGSNSASFHATGFRNDSNRSGTTPAHDWANWPASIPAYVKRLRGVVIESRPAIQVMQEFDRTDTLFYVDPPYPHETRGTRQAYEVEMSADDHRALAATLRSLQGMVVLSGYTCELYDAELYPDWKRIERAAHADGARDRTEVLWLSPNVREQRLFQ